ncbi:MAG: hypothetical protein HUU55_09985 [Myxococcales bacterium]|nr:hypothetical protein [Myxococcales bacterium]
MVQKLAKLADVVEQGQGIPIAVLVGVLMATLLEVCRRAMQSLLDRAAAREAGESHCCCGCEQVSRGFEAKRFICRFGRLSYRRRRWLCLKCGRTELDRGCRWELPAGRYSAEIREATERLSCRLGYGEAVDELMHLWGVGQDKSTAKRWVDRDGAKLEQHAREQAAQHWAHYRQPHSDGYAGAHRAGARENGYGVGEMDGVHVLTWKPEQQPRLKPTAGPTEATSAEPAEPVSKEVSELNLNPTRHQPDSVVSEVEGSPMGPVGRSPRVRGREVCMGMIYLQEDAVEESPGRGALLDPRYVATLNEREHFGTKKHAAAATKGVLRRTAVVSVTDGSSYLIQQNKECFWGEPLVPIIDIQQVRQHVWEAGHALHSDTTALQQWV